MLDETILDETMLDEIKNYLDITWQDIYTDDKLTGIIKRAISTLQSYAGAEIDLEIETDEKQLLFDCIRYIYNNAFEHFKVNFADELLMLRAKYQTASIVLEADVDE